MALFDRTKSRGRSTDHAVVKEGKGYWKRHQVGFSPEVQERAHGLASAAMVTSWPMTSTVGVTTPGLWRGSGVLSVAPGSIVCAPGRLIARASAAHPVMHEGARAHINLARLVPPWFNVTIPIRAEGGTLIASMWVLARRRLRTTLQQAGFDVTEHVT